MEITITQQEELWQEARLSRFTASEIHKLMGSSRSGDTLLRLLSTKKQQRFSQVNAKQFSEMLLNGVSNTNLMRLTISQELHLMSLPTTEVKPMYLFHTETIAAILLTA